MESAEGFLSIFSIGAESLFYFCLLFAICFFIISELAWMTRKILRPASLGVPRQHIEVLWSLVPAIILLLLTLVHAHQWTQPKVAIEKESKVSVGKVKGE